VEQAVAVKAQLAGLVDLEPVLTAKVAWQLVSQPAFKPLEQMLHSLEIEVETSTTQEPGQVVVEVVPRPQAPTVPVLVVAQVVLELSTIWLEQTSVWPLVVEVEQTLEQLAQEELVQG